MHVMGGMTSHRCQVVAHDTWRAIIGRRAGPNHPRSRPRWRRAGASRGDVRKHKHQYGNRISWQPPPPPAICSLFIPSTHQVGGLPLGWRDTCRRFVRYLMFWITSDPIRRVETSSTSDVAVSIICCVVVVVLIGHSSVAVITMLAVRFSHHTAIMRKNNVNFNVGDFSRIDVVHVWRPVCSVCLW